MAAHGMRLWPKPLVRKITFHHLRHTAGSLLLLTSGIYGHLLMSYQREAISKARLLPKALLETARAESQGTAPGARTSTALADYLLTNGGPDAKRAGTSSG